MLCPPVGDVADKTERARETIPRQYEYYYIDIEQDQEPTGITGKPKHKTHETNKNAFVSLIDLTYFGHAPESKTEKKEDGRYIFSVLIVRSVTHP